ncbi:FCD domain-containing protein [Bradyrhizobium hipponense]|uniref:FCD domain-containing protein n=1 Tax=Bradyrhizobium hipponense TaxID=2605638 RepID=A0A5S4YQA0_9BRAD|nr:FCD domain-containing protein [Bradyrhizobium hipponense]TYO65844.1 FCD domain-containing protein [Bradyrhizobium hipponense]
MPDRAIRPRKEFGKTIAADITHRLREEIIACGLLPGEPLRFDVLRERFGASFTTLREALTALSAEGLVDAQEQRGFRVAPVSGQDLVEVTDARVLIDVELIRRSIQKGDDDWEIAVISTLHRLKRIEQRDPEQALRDAEWKIAHRQFHQALVSACGSATLLAIRAELFDRAERYRYLSANFRPRPRDKAGEHQAIMQAAISRNAEQAAELIETHIRSTADNVAKYAGHLLEAG